MPSVVRLFIHPIKSLPRVAVSRATFTVGGSLAHDREFALFDPDGQVVNGKRLPLVHQVRAEYDLAALTVSLRDRDDHPSSTFHLLDDRARIEGWFSTLFGFPVTLERNQTTGFPDDTVAPGPTIVSETTLDQVSTWFPGMGANEASRRFRANIEVGGVPAFWEDRLFGDSGATVAFAIGGARLEGVNPCQRCVVPTRDPDTGTVIQGFQRTFSERRKATLPKWAAAERFDHFYRLSVNTRVSSTESGTQVQLGDELVVTGSRGKIG